MSEDKDYRNVSYFIVFKILGFFLIMILSFIFFFIIYDKIISGKQENYIKEFYYENKTRIRKITFDNFSKKLPFIRININQLEDEKYNIEIDTDIKMGVNDSNLKDNLQLTSIKNSNEINEIIKQKNIKPNTLSALKMIDTLIFQSNNEKMYQIKSIYLSRDSEDSTFACQFIMYDGFLDALGQLTLVYTQSDYKKVKYYGYGKKNRKEEFDKHFFSNVLGFRD